MSPDAKKILKFIYLIDKMKFIKRSITLSSGEQENDAEHSWHLSLMVWLFAGQYDKKINIDKAIKMALAHDLVEIYSGDVFAFDHQGRIGKFERELVAAKKLFRQLPLPLSQELMELWLEHEELKSVEARYVQSLDKMQPIIQNVLSKGNSWRDYKITEQMNREYKTPYHQDSHFSLNLFNHLLGFIKRKKFY